MTKEFVDLGWDISVYTVNPGNLKIREILGGVDIYRPPNSHFHSWGAS